MIASSTYTKLRQPRTLILNTEPIGHTSDTSLPHHDVRPAMAFPNVEHVIQLLTSITLGRKLPSQSDTRHVVMRFNLPNQGGFALNHAKCNTCHIHLGLQISSNEER